VFNAMPTSPPLTEALPALNDPVIVRGYALLGISEKEAMALEEHVLTAMAMYWWVVFVLWATRRGWE
jgi:hypothetical protein